MVCPFILPTFVQAQREGWLNCCDWIKRRSIEVLVEEVRDLINRSYHRKKITGKKDWVAIRSKKQKGMKISPLFILASASCLEHYTSN